MKIAIILLSFLFVSVNAQASKQETVLPSQCSGKLVAYDKWEKLKNPVFLLNLQRNSGGTLYYYGAEHSTDLTHKQFREIEEAWAKVKPEIAFYEGPNRPILDSREETIQKTGESGFVRFLAKRDGIPFVTLEPSPSDEVKFIQKKYSFEQTMLFFVLRETARLRERQNLPEDKLKQAVSQLLRRAQKIEGLENIPKDLTEIEAAYKRYWNTPANWWEAPQEWFDPLKQSKDTGGIFTNEINKRSSEFRNLYMYESLAKKVLEGKKVFAVVGRNHVPMQAEALKCALK
jgi:hypothetical protein